MIKWMVAAGACLALALLTLNASSERHFDHVDAAPGAPATMACAANAKPANMNFTLKDVDGKDLKLASLKGKVVLLDFWATWCGPCKIEIPWFIEFQKKYGPAGLQVVGVSIDDTQAKLKPYVAQMKMNYPVLQGLDHDDVQDAYGPMFGIPVTVVISRDGKMCAKHVGLSSKDAFEKPRSSRCCSMIESMLKGFTHARLACGCRVAFREGVEGSPSRSSSTRSRRRARSRCT